MCCDNCGLSHLSNWIWFRFFFFLLGFRQKTAHCTWVLQLDASRLWQVDPLSHTSPTFTTWSSCKTRPEQPSRHTIPYSTTPTGRTASRYNNNQTDSHKAVSDLGETEADDDDGWCVVNGGRRRRRCTIYCGACCCFRDLGGMDFLGNNTRMGETIVVVVLVVFVIHSERTKRCSV